MRMGRVYVLIAVVGALLGLAIGGLPKRGHDKPLQVIGATTTTSVVGFTTPSILVPTLPPTTAPPSSTTSTTRPHR